MQPDNWTQSWVLSHLINRFKDSSATHENAVEHSYNKKSADNHAAKAKEHRVFVEILSRIQEEVK